MQESPHSATRLARYARYRAYYEGDQWEGPPAPGERRLTFNYARVFCNKAAAYLMGKPPGWDATPRPGDPSTSSGQALGGGRMVEDYLAGVAEANYLAAVDLDTVLTATILGDGAWTVRWDAAAGAPRVTAVDPAGLDCRARPDDPFTLTWLRQRYWLAPADLPPDQAAVLARAEAATPAGDPLAPLEAEEVWTPQAWSLTVAGVRVAGGPHPYGQIPYILFPNLRLPGEFWGESDLADLLRLQRELNSRLSIFSRILEVAGNPVAVVSGADAAATESLRLGPNQLWTLPEGEKAEVLQLLEAGGAEAHLRYVDLIYRAMHDISEMPRTSFGDSSGGGSTARSGVALEIELQPLLHKLARKRAILAIALTRRADLILRMARLHGVALPPVRLRVSWPPVLPQDRAALVQQEVALVAAGIHPPTAAMAALDDPDPDAQLARVVAEAALLKRET
jgi:hypothetical protein